MALQVSLPPFLPLASLEAQAFTQTLVAAEARAEVKGEPSIPAEVQGWADAASAAYEKGSPAEALRLQQRVVAWVRAEGGAETLFQAYALANQGLYLGAVGRKKEAETAYGEALRRYQALARTMPSDSPDRPAVFQNLSRMLSELGRPQEALEPQREAVRLSRERAAANPASRKELAARLYRLGELFRSLDRHQEALPALEEAGALYQQLAQGDQAFLSQRADALVRALHSSFLLGRNEKALALAQETVALRREIVKRKPADAGHRAALAEQISMVGLLYKFRLNNNQQAVPAFQEAVNIDRELARINPNFQPGLAENLLLLGQTLNALARPGDALAAAEEAAALYQRLAQGDQAFLSQRADALDLARAVSSQLGQKEKALALAQETVALRREIVKRKPADTSRREALADALLRLGIGLALGMHPDALPALREAEQITRELAKASPAFKANLAEVLTELGRFCPLQSCATGEGLAAAREAVQIYRPLAISTPALQVNLAEALTATAVEYMALTQPQLALAPIQEAVAITGAMTNTTPASRNARATALVLQAQILSLLKQPTKPVKAAKEATPKGPEGMGADADPIQKMADASLRLQNAINFTELGQWDRALQASLEAVDQLRDSARAIPYARPMLAAGLWYLGLEYIALGREAEAQAPLREAQLILGEIKTTSPFLVYLQSVALSSLGYYYTETGRYGLALAQHQQAAAMLRQLIQTNPEFTEELASKLRELGESLYDLERYPEALALYQEAHELLRKAAHGGPLPPDRAVAILSSLGRVHDKLGQPGRAIAFLRDAIPLRRRQAQGSALARGDLGSNLSSLGAVLAEAGQANQALAPSQEAVAIHRQLASTNPLFLRALAKSSTNLANLRRLRGDAAAALPLMREAVTSEVLVLQRQLPLMPEMRRQAYVDTLERRWEIPFSLARQSEAGASLALFTRLNRFSPLQDIERRQAILSRASTATRTQLDRLNALTANLANPSLKASARQKALDESEALQDALFRQLPVLAPRLIEVGAVAQRLPPDGALLEFQRFSPHQPGRREEQSWDKPRYLALVLDPSGRVQATDLGEAEPLDRAIAVALDRTRRQEPGSDQAWALVAERLFLPLRTSLAGRRHLLIAPDGQLHRVPFSALALLAGTDKPLLTGVTLQTIVSGRDLVPVPGSHPRPTAPLVLADPTTSGWAPLARAAAEGEAVATRLGVQANLGPAASVALLEQARGPRILHVAAHGYFQPQDFQPQDNPTNSDRGDPLLSSGLVLAGAVKARLPGHQAQGTSPAAPASGDDGYLTAQEAARLQLEGTDLVVLSACETGRGSYRSGEGLFGLQRALTVAGARGTLLSLWKVPEHATETFMGRFYTLLGQGVAPAEAVRRVQAEFRSQPRIDGWSDPYYWAGWQYSGPPDHLK